MADKSNNKAKGKLTLVDSKPNLTVKQKLFADGILSGKSQKQSYIDAYNVDTNKGIAWVNAESSKLATCNPNITLYLNSQKNALEQKQLNHLAIKSNRVREYVLESLMRESKEADSSSSQIRALELLGKTCGLFETQITVTESRSADTVKQDLEQRLLTMLSSKD